MTCGKNNKVLVDIYRYVMMLLMVQISGKLTS